MKRPIDKQLLLVSAGVAVGLVLIVAGFRAGSTGRDSLKLPEVIETMSVSPGDQVLQQSQISVDLLEGYEASLTLDGIALETTRLDELSAGGAAPKPGEQVEIPPTAIFDPGNNIISYTPQIGAPIEAFSQGEHVAVLKYWKIVEGEAKARTFKWTFSAD